jgi:hypothetical protein
LGQAIPLAPQFLYPGQQTAALALMEEKVSQGDLQPPVFHGLFHLRQMLPDKFQVKHGSPHQSECRDSRRREVEKKEKGKNKK